MSEQNPPDEPETISSLSRSLNQFIDYVGQSQRNHEVQLQSQQAQINALNQLARQLAETQIEMFTRFDQMQAEIREMQSEVRGLQTENRRMLDQFLNEQEPPEELN